MRPFEIFIVLAEILFQAPFEGTYPEATQGSPKILFFHPLWISPFILFCLCMFRRPSNFLLVRLSYCLD